jgi:phosphate transport system substrate-binding protein
VAVIAAGVVSLSGAAAASAATVNGAGATFSAPFWQQVGSDFKARFGDTVNYQGVGSGAGISQFTAHTVDFGGSDVPMTSAEQGKAQAGGVDVLHFPAVLGAVTVSYNVSGLKSGLKLDGPTLAKIYLGRITRWNDAAIAKLNKGVRLPAQEIAVIHRSDSSGTTNAWTTFLGGWSSEWRRGPGIGKDVKWPLGTGARGNDGVSASIKQTPGSIGYVELAYAVQNGFTYAAVKNRAGRWELPRRAATAAAATGIVVPPTLKVKITNSSNKNAYPISAASFAMVYKDPCKAGADTGAATALKHFLAYAVGNEGQKAAKKLLYAPLPRGLQKKTLTAIGKLTCNGAAIK